MPTQIDLTDRPKELSPEFSYLHAGGDAVHVAAPQGAHEMTEEQTLKEGDTVNSANHLVAYSSGEARLLQYSHEEEMPGEKKTAKKDDAPKAKKDDSKKDE